MEFSLLCELPNSPEYFLPWLGECFLPPPENPMKFLCLAYGAEKDWLGLTKQEQEEFLAQDEVLRNRGNFMAAVGTTVATVTAWNGSPTTVRSTFAQSSVPLAGFAIIEAKDINEVVQLVANTPCARAKGAIEIRPLMQTGSP